MTDIDADIAPVGNISQATMYIPFYQREYHWDPGWVRQLIEDLAGSAAYLPHLDGRGWFVGSVITAEASEAESSLLDPWRGDLVGVIDGQQRLTTFALIACALRDHLGRLSERADIGQDDEAERMLGTIVGQLDSDLLQLYAVGGDGTSAPWQSRICRIFEDRWSMTGDPIMRSPVASLIYEHVQHHPPGYNPPAPFDPTVSSHPQSFSAAEDYKTVKNRYRQISNLVSQVAAATTTSKGRYAYNGEPIRFTHEWTDVLRWRKKINFGNRDDHALRLIERTRESAEDEAEEHEAFAQLIRLAIFAKFCLNLTEFAWISSSDEHRALNMFETLNTRGELLDALQCFRPVVARPFIDAPQAWSQSDERGLLDQVANKLGTPEQRRTPLKNAVVALGVAEEGKKVGRSLEAQRDFLAQAYRSDYGGTELLKSLVSAAEVSNDLWLNGRGHRAVAGDEIGQTFVLFMHRSNHTIAQGLVSRYLLEVDSGRVSRAELVRLIKAVGAFWALWRTTEKGYPDDLYRRLMAEGLEGSGPVARVKSVGSPVDVGTVVAALRSKIKSEGEWIDAAKRQEVYGTAGLDRILLCAAGHGKRFSGEDGWVQTMRGSPGSNLLSPDVWESEQHNSVEHILPQEQPADGSWPTELYSDPSLKHLLGNLTLLPQGQNASLSQYGPDVKRAAFYALSLETRRDLDEYLESNQWLPEAVRNYLREQGQHVRGPFMAELASREAWDETTIRSRTEELLGLAYRELVEHLR